MRFEIPECRRCVFCMPLRYGIFILGYLNLLFTILLLVVELWFCWDKPADVVTRNVYRGVIMFSHMWLCVLLYSLEIIFNIVLIVGAHMKRKLLMRIYYYYGIVTTAATFVTLFVLKFHDYYQGFPPSLQPIEIVVEMSVLVVHIYLLIMIRSELSKSRYQSGVTFVNQVAEVVSPPPWGDGRNPL